MSEEKQQSVPENTGETIETSPKTIETPQDILQTVAQQKLTGALFFEKDGQTAAIYVKEGTVWHASTSALIGDDAVLEILLWTDGECRFEETPPPANRTTFIPWGQGGAQNSQALAVPEKPLDLPKVTANFSRKTHSAKLVLPDGQSVELTQATTKVGHGNHCDLVLNTLSVQPEHCVFTLTQDTVAIAACSPDALIWINGRKTLSQILQQGDTIKIGDVEIKFLISIRRFIPGAIPTLPGNADPLALPSLEAKGVKFNLHTVLVLIFILAATALAAYLALDQVVPARPFGAAP